MAVSNTLVKISKFISTGAYSGLIKGPRGTWGSTAALALWFALGGPELGIETTLFGTLLLTVLGFLSTKIFIKSYVGPKSEDPSCVVIDEWAGMWLSLVAATTPLEAVVAFILFRVLDALKPYPIKTLEEIPGAAGIMLDDLGAASIAILLLNGFVRL